MRKLILGLAAFCAASVTLAQEADVDRVVGKYLKYRPSEAELAMYTLDWADSLTEALQRGAGDNRPLVMVIIHAQYGDIRSGHC
ncbi:hypothetical protein OAF83_03815 [Rubripirellula sp.]|jgi:hypothetical protein|nr:hypothetical protein [Rubripirellula sp.]MDB4750012.1 hypothetical protein [Rubripirellula sp.]